MNATKQAAWIFCLLIALAGSGWYFASSSPKPMLDETTLANTPDTIVFGLTIRQFTEKGLLGNLLQSKKMEHIPNNNTNLLQSPHIIISQDNEPSWDIRSEKAESINKGTQITFINKVIIHQDKGEKNQESTFNTEKLVYFPKQKFATTDLAVIFEQQGSVIHSKGMNAYLENKHVELLGKARLIYRPNHA